MREIPVSIIEEKVKELFIKANTFLPEDLEDIIKNAKNLESDSTAKNIFCDMCENLKIAKELQIPICQDTGMAVLFVEVGQDVHFTDGNLNDAINRGVKKAYLDGKMRCSIVNDPIKRGNTNDNTPALVHFSFCDGENVKLTASPKGFGSENMSKIKMFTPSATKEDIMDFVIDVVKTAGGNPCPPIVLGIGIGGDFEYCAYLSKKALCRSVDESNENPFYAEMEKTLLNEINKLNFNICITRTINKLEPYKFFRFNFPSRKCLFHKLAPSTIFRNIDINRLSYPTRFF